MRDVSSARDLRPLLALVAVNGAADGALLPLLPTLRDDLGLSGLEIAMLLSATTVAMLVGAVPAGLLAGRFGVHRLLTLVALVLPLSLAGMALAPSFPLLFAARTLFGLSFCILWVVAPAWIASSHGTAGTGRLLAASGVGWLGGPLVAGLVADVAGWRTGLAVVGLASVPVVPALLRVRATGSGEQTRARLRPALRTLRDQRSVRVVVATSAVLGVVTGVSGLLPAYVLAENGLSAGGIGIAMGLAAGVWIAAARATGRLAAGRQATLGWALVALASVWLLPVLSLSTVAVLGFLLVSAACRSALNTLVYAVGAQAVGHVAAPAVVGMMNLGWAVAALIAPFAAGAAESGTGVRAVFAATAAAAAVVGWSALRARRPCPAAV